MKKLTLIARHDTMFIQTKNEEKIKFTRRKTKYFEIPNYFKNG